MVMHSNTLGAIVARVRGRAASRDASGTTGEPVDDLRSPVLAGLLIAAVMVAGTAGWAARVEIAGAVVATGTVVVDSHTKKVQHPTGGVVGEILVRDGDRVRENQPVLRLDETVTRANYQMLSRQLDEFAARHARLASERDEADRLVVPADLDSRRHDPDIARLLAGEASLFESRRIARDGRKAQLRERIVQLGQEVAGHERQVAAKSREIALIETELEGQRELWAKKLIPIGRFTQTQREASRLDGERGQLIAAMAQARGRMAEIELQIMQIDHDRRAEIVREMRDIEARRAELSERRVAAEDQLRRVEIRAPQDGVVHQLAVHTVGGVVNAGETLMLVVPEGDRLVVEARVAPRDIDSVLAGQAASIRFPAFNQRTTPEFDATVTRVSADLARDPQTDATFFGVRVELTGSAVSALGELRLRAGMPADVHIKTDYRTALSYLVKPLEDQVAKAFRER